MRGAYLRKTGEDGLCVAIKMFSSCFFCVPNKPVPHGLWFKDHMWAVKMRVFTNNPEAVLVMARLTSLINLWNSSQNANTIAPQRLLREDNACGADTALVQTHDQQIVVALR